MNITIGSFTPSRNIRCQVTGKPFGPGAPQKTGFQVEAKGDDKTFRYAVASRASAEKLAQTIQKEWKYE